MKKILMSLFTIAIVGALVTGGAIAYFNDVETSTGNTFTAGTLDLKVNNEENPWVSKVDATLKDVKPCEVRLVTITLENVGSNPMDVWKILKDVVPAGGLFPESEKGEDASNTINDIDGVIRYDLSVNTEPKITEAMDYTISAGTHQLAVLTAGVAGKYIYLGTIAVGGTMTVVQSYHMDGATTNWAQGDTMTFTIEFFAQQTTGDAPSPTPQLAGHGKP